MDYFVGRVEELLTLTEGFIGGARVAVIYGTWGTGKTALARFFADTSKDLFPGGCVTCKAFLLNLSGSS